MKEKLKSQVTEYLDFLKESPFFGYCDYFSGLALDSVDFLSQGRKLVGITSLHFPELFVRACGATPVYLPGGYSETCDEVEEIFPQVSDRVSKSVMSLLLSSELGFREKLSGVIVSISNDSNTKLSYYLRQKGFNVITVEKNPFSLERVTRNFIRSQKTLLLELMKLSRRPITKKRLIDTARMITKSRELFKRLDASILETRVTNFIKETYYLTQDVAEWQTQVEHLLSFLPPHCNQEKPALLLGGEIQFPNYKLTSVLQETGIHWYDSRCCAPCPCDYGELNEKMPLMLLLRQIYRIHYRNQYNSDMVSGQYAGFADDVKAVIFHLLKGQLLSAYHADKIERSCIRNSIPYIGVETDYTNADKEQIKIRIEAFVEMLNVMPGEKGEGDERKVA